MQTEYPNNALSKMVTMLDYGKRRIISANIIKELKMNIHTAAIGITFISMLFLVLRIFAWLFGTPSISGFTSVIIAVVFIVSLLIYSVFKGSRNAAVKPYQVAERLDISQETHNKIATAIELLKSKNDSPFAQAAINDGWQTLTSVHQEDPHENDSSLAWNKIMLLIILSIMFFLIGIFLTPKTNQLNSIVSPKSLIPTTPETILKPAKKKNIVSTTEDSAAPNDSNDKDQKPNNSDKNTAAKVTEPKKATPSTDSSGKAGNNSPSKSKKSSSASKSSSAASGDSSKSKSKPKKTTNKKVKSKPKNKKTKKNAKKKNKKTGSISANGASGSSSKSPTENKWSSKIKAKASKQEEEPQDEENDDAGIKNKLNSGVQPNLKNRISKLSRSLSLQIGRENQQRRKRAGRGGPSGAKKKRGTATMILGVPVPGFVRGRLLPGATKTTQEEVKPTPKLGKFNTMVNVKEFAPEENTQEHFRPKFSNARQAKQYLIQYHAENENNRKDNNAGK